MKTMIKTRMLLAFVAGLSAMTLCAADRPKGWMPAGNNPANYEMTTDHTQVHGGKASATLKCTAAKPRGFGTLMQTVKADAFRGKRVRFSGYVRSQDVTDWSGLWMRIDGPNQQMLGFDNMQERPIKGTTDWALCEIVLDVPSQAESFSFGLLLSKGGQAWMDDLKFEVVGSDVPTTGKAPVQTEPLAPRNLNFEE